jgi:hypothetical protein
MCCYWAMRQGFHYCINQWIPSVKISLGCCLNHCTTVVLTSSSHWNLWPFSAFLDGGTHGCLGCMAKGPTPSSTYSSVSWTEWATWRHVSCAVQYNDTICEQARTHSLNGGTNILDCFTTALC